MLRYLPTPLFSEGTLPPLLPPLIVGSILFQAFWWQFWFTIYTWSQTQGVMHTCTHKHVPKSLKIDHLKGPFLQLNNKLVWKSLWKGMKLKKKTLYFCSLPRGNNWILLALSSWHWLLPWLTKYVYIGGSWLINFSHYEFIFLVVIWDLMSFSSHSSPLHLDRLFLLFLVKLINRAYITSAM